MRTSPFSLFSHSCSPLSTPASYPATPVSSQSTPLLSHPSNPTLSAERIPLTAPIALSTPQPIHLRPHRPLYLFSPSCSRQAKRTECVAVKGEHPPSPRPNPSLGPPSPIASSPPAPHQVHALPPPPAPFPHLCPTLPSSPEASQGHAQPTATLTTHQPPITAHAAAQIKRSMSNQHTQRPKSRDRCRIYTRRHLDPEIDVAGAHSGT